MIYYCSNCGAELTEADSEAGYCTQCKTSLRLTNAELARLLDSAASALRHGRISTARKKVREVYHQL